MAYSRSDQQEGAVAKHRRAQNKRYKVIGFFAVFSVLVAGIITVCVHPKMYMNDIQLKGFRLSDNVEVQNQVRTYLDHKVFMLIPRWNRFFVGRHGLKKMLHQLYPIFSTISITKQKQTLIIQVSERTADYLWCETTDSTDAQLPACAYMDTSGFLFEQAPYFSQSSRIVFYSAMHAVGSNAISAQIIDHVAQYKHLLQELHFTLHKVIVTDFDVTLQGTFADNRAMQSSILIKPEDDPKTVVLYLQVLSKDGEFAKSFKTIPLQYVDTRSGKILYYRFDI